MKRTLPLLPLLATLLVAPQAFAHPGHAENASFFTAFLHPLTGLDHLLAMLAVGLWSVGLHKQTLSARLLMLPIAFVAFLLAGALLGSTMSIPAVEPVIATSLLVLGVAAALTRQIPQWAALAIVALFASFHGLAHGAELGNSTAALAGITVSTALLHLAGIGLGFNMQVRRVLGGCVAAGGVFFLMQLA